MRLTRNQKRWRMKCRLNGLLRGEAHRKAMLRSRRADSYFYIPRTVRAHWKAKKPRSGVKVFPYWESR